MDVLFHSGANIVYYQDKQTGAIDVTCKTGITGVANDEITMSISFTGDDTNTTCSTICNNGPQVPCDWNSMEWIESEGTCTIVANATVANSGGFCCDNNAVDSRVIACENVSIVKDCIITPSEDPANHSSQPSILVDSVIGVSCLLLIVLIVIGIVVFYWKRRNRYNEGIIHASMHNYYVCILRTLAWPHIHQPLVAIDMTPGIFYSDRKICNLLESVDSLCRDGTDTPMLPYIGKAFTRTNFEELGLFRYLIMVCE